MACLEAIEPFVRGRHELGKSGWKYVPRVEMRVSSVEGKLALRTTRDQGFSRTGESADDLHDDNLPDWEHSVSCPADVMNIEDGGSFRVDLNHDFLKTIVEALKDAGEEIRIYFDHREAPLHFEVGRTTTLPCSCRCGWLPDFFLNILPNLLYHFVQPSMRFF